MKNLILTVAILWQAACSNSDAAPSVGAGGNGGSGGSGGASVAGSAGSAGANGLDGGAVGGGGMDGGSAGAPATGGDGGAAPCHLTAELMCSPQSMFGDEPPLCNGFPARKYDAVGHCVGPLINIACGGWGPQYTAALACYETLDAGGAVTAIYQASGSPYADDMQLATLGIRTCTQSEYDLVWLGGDSPPDCP